MKAICDNKSYKGLIESEEQYENVKNGKADWKAHIKPKIKSVIIPYDLFLRLMEADRKQTPKKPKITIHGTTGYSTKEYCPVCNAMVHGNYCWNCGQALDWGYKKK